MILRKIPFFTGAALLAFLPAPGLRAQAPAPAPAAATAPMTFGNTLGTRTVDGATYTVEATEPADSGLKSQRVRFTAVVPTGTGKTTRYFMINTGKYKTVAQLDAYLRESFGKFLSGAPANTEVGKVGDIKYGVVEAPNDTLRYEAATAGEQPSSMMLTRAEVTAYVAILSGK